MVAIDGRTCTVGTQAAGARAPKRARTRTYTRASAGIEWGTRVHVHYNIENVNLSSLPHARSLPSIPVVSLELVSVRGLARSSPHSRIHPPTATISIVRYFIYSFEFNSAAIYETGMMRSTLVRTLQLGIDSNLLLHHRCKALVHFLPVYRQQRVHGRTSKAAQSKQRKLQTAKTSNIDSTINMTHPLMFTSVIYSVSVVYA
jgi:hypothetical protein